jgi:transposase-like protein
VREVLRERVVDLERELAEARAEIARLSELTLENAGAVMKRLSDENNKCPSFAPAPRVVQ